MTLVNGSLIVLMCGALLILWRFKRVTTQIIDDRQQYHRTMTPKQIRASRRFFYRSTIKKTLKLRRLGFLQRVSTLITVIGVIVSMVLFAGVHFAAIVAIVAIGCLVIGSGLAATFRWLLNRELIKLTTVPNDSVDPSLLVVPQHLATRELRVIFWSSALLPALAIWLAWGVWSGLTAAIDSQQTHVVTKVSAANQNVRQIQQLATDHQKLSTRAKMTLFSMYAKDITNYDLDSDSTYTYHVIRDGAMTWYVLMENSEDNGLSFYYLVRENADHRIQMYYFPDKTGAKTALHGLVPKYTPYYQTEVKLGQLTTAFMPQKDYQSIIKLMHPGKKWQY